MNAPTVATLNCPDCRGEGFLRGTDGRLGQCPRCRGAGLIAVVNNELVTYTEQFSGTSLHLERLHRLVRALVDGAAVVFGLVGLFVGFTELLGTGRQGGSAVDLVLRESPGMAIFWLSVLVDLYVYYRLEQSLRRSVKMKPPVVQAEPPTDFVTAMQKPVADVTTALSLNARLAMTGAWELANRSGHTPADARHILAALLAQRGPASAMLRLGVAPQQLRDRLKRLQDSAPRGAPTVIGREAHEVVTHAYAETRRRRGRAVDTLDLLSALAQVDGPVRDLLDDLAVEAKDLRNVSAWLQMEEELRRRWSHFRSRAAFKPKGTMDRAMTASATPTLNQFSHDLTALARAGGLALTVDREDETNAVFRAMEGKANALLVGNPGVGKTALVEGIANRMVEEDIPEIFQDKRLVSLSVPALVSGAGAIGQLEQRFTEILDEVARAGNIILFIDNIQNLVGVSSSGGETMDLSGILAQYLQNRQVTAIATTTVQDYARYIERSGALLSTFDKVDLPELNHDATILVLEAKAGHIEHQHNVFFSYAAIAKTVEFAERYLHEQFQPQKSIDLLEEVAIATHRRKGKDAFVLADDVAAVVSEKTHIEVRAVTEKESEKLLNLEVKMHERVVGQDEAVKAVSSALRRARAELRDTNRPIATFLFLGPTGVGKTELAKTVADVYFGSEKAMIRLDMSEYQDSASIYRMIGAPGGSGEGYLTQAVRQNPFTLVLLDELEKAHPDILNVFLQVMDDGRLTDSLGRTVDFTNAIIIATSNAGTDVIQQRMKEGASVTAVKNELLNTTLAQYYRPEFLNRFDGIIVFTPLSETEIVKITDFELRKVAKQLAEKGITLRASPEAIRELGAIGFDPVFGARPLRRAIQENVDNALANFLLTGKLGRRDVAVLDAGGVIRVEKAQTV